MISTGADGAEFCAIDALDVGGCEGTGVEREEDGIVVPLEEFGRGRLRRFVVPELFCREPGCIGGRGEQ